MLSSGLTYSKFFVPVSLNSTENTVGLVLVLVGWGYDREGASSLELDRQQNQAGWSLGLSKAEGGRQQGCTE